MARTFNKAYHGLHAHYSARRDNGGLPRTHGFSTRPSNAKQTPVIR